jgi:hypothetical protein
MTDSFRDLSHLPKAERQTEGEPPDKESRFGRVLIDAWHLQADDDKPNAVAGARFRHSNAGACSRAVAYAALGVPVSNPMDAPSHYITTLGSKIHEWWQEALQEEYAHADIEVKVGEPGSMFGGHVDAVIRDSNDHVIAIELKSVGGYAYKLACGGMGPAKGPSYTYKIQAALNAKAVDADEAVVVLLARDAFNYAEDKGLEPFGRVTAEWTYPREVYEPIADKEIERINAILALVDEGTLPRRKIPDPEYPTGHIIRHPKTKGGKGEWVEIASDPHGEQTEIVVNAGAAWQCAYCRYQDTCARTGAHREPVEVLVQLGVLNEEALRNGGPREQ